MESKWVEESNELIAQHDAVNGMANAFKSLWRCTQHQSTMWEVSLDRNFLMHFNEIFFLETNIHQTACISCTYKDLNRVMSFVSLDLKLQVMTAMELVESANALPSIWT